MMRAKFTFKKAVYLLAAVSILSISFNNLFKTSREETGDRKAERIESKKARTEWEFNRLRNPKTNTIPANIRRKELSFAKTISKNNSLLSKGSNLHNGLTWTFRGPKNVGGRTRALAVDVTNENRIIAGGAVGGMWRSEDGGRSWIKTTTPDQLHSVTSVAQDTRPGKTHIWYYGTGEYRANSIRAGGGTLYRGDGVFKSIDGGVSWQQLETFTSNTPEITDNLDFIHNIVIDDNNLIDDVIYIASYGGIYRSMDGGETVEYVLGSDETPKSAYSHVAISHGILYATLSSEGRESGIFRSVDGENWANITPEGWPDLFYRTVLDISPSKRNVVYFLSHTPNSGMIGDRLNDDHQMWKYKYDSGDGTGSGGFWEDLTEYLPRFGGKAGNYSSQVSYNMLIKVKPGYGNTVFLGGRNLYRLTQDISFNIVSRWIGGYLAYNNYSNYPGHHADQHAVVFMPSDPSIMISAHDGGLSKTMDNNAVDVDWESLNKGYITTQFCSVALDHKNLQSSLVLGGMQDNGNWFSDSYQKYWNELPGGGDGTFLAIGDEGKTIFFGTQYGKIFMIENGVATSGEKEIHPGDRDNCLFVNPFILDRNNHNMVYQVVGDYIWRTKNVKSLMNNYEGGWRMVNASHVVDSKITSLEVSKSPANVLYFGTDNGQVFRIERANEDYSVRVDVSDGLPNNGAYVSSISVNPNDALEVMLVYSNYEVISAFHSDNGGNTWTNISGTLEENPDGSGSGPSVRWCEILPLDNKTMYLVGTSIGLFATEVLTGENTVWVQEGASTIGNVIVNMIDSSPLDGRIAVATFGRGVYSSKAGVIVSVDENEQVIPTEFDLRQNYPNPFNPETVIEFSLLKSEAVELKVYSQTGQLVRELSNGQYPAGTHSIKWDGKTASGSSAAAGVYFYRLTAGKVTKVKKMMLIK